MSYHSFNFNNYQLMASSLVFHDLCSHLIQESCGIFYNVYLDLNKVHCGQRMLFIYLFVCL